MEEERSQYLRAIFDGIPMPMFIVDDGVRIQDFNTAAEEFLGPQSVTALHGVCGDVFHCVNATDHGCGNAKPCRACAIRNSVKKANSGEIIQRELHVAKLRTPTRTFTQELLISAALLPYTEAPRVLLVLEDLSRIDALRKRGKG